MVGKNGDRNEMDRSDEVEDQDEKGKGGKVEGGE